MQDLTVIYLTANKLPQTFAMYQSSVLAKAIKGYPLIIVTRERIITAYENVQKFIIDINPKSHANMYYQLLHAAREAKTKYVAVAEDDVLYSKEHFNSFRPQDNEVAYDMSRWSLFTWNPIFNLKQRVSNCTLIAPKKYLIEALEERFAKYSAEEFPPHLVSEIGRYEKNLGITQRNMVKFYSEVPCIQLNHPNGTDSTEKRKRMGQIKALDIPYWGKAEDIVNIYLENNLGYCAEEN